MTPMNRVITINPCQMQLVDLPPEMQLMILEAEPTTLTRMAQVNHWFHDLTDQAIARHFGERLISKIEFEAHVKTQPHALGQFNLIKNKPHLTGYADQYKCDLSYGITPDMFISIDSAVKVYSSSVHVTLLNRADMTLDVSWILRERTGVTYDLLTQYQILSRRRQCVDWVQKQGQGRHYARDVVLDVLDNAYGLTRSNRVGETLGIYMYLLMHAIILRTPTIPPREHMTNLDLTIDAEGYLSQTGNTESELKVYQDIQTNLQIMYQEIRDHLMTL
jgi:hypothetical protein